MKFYVAGNDFILCGGHKIIAAFRHSGYGSGSYPDAWWSVHYVRYAPHSTGIYRKTMFRKLIAPNSAHYSFWRAEIIKTPSWVDMVNEIGGIAKVHRRKYIAGTYADDTIQEFSHVSEAMKYLYIQHKL